jgi:glycine/sarcosine/betaine reductase complex component A
MGLEDQAEVRRVAGEFEDVVVLLGTPDVESTRTLAETVVTGDPSFAGPLAGVPLGLPVVHIFEPAIEVQIPPDVFEAQVALMELSLDAPGIVAALSTVRQQGAPEPP